VIGGRAARISAPRCNSATCAANTGGSSRLRDCLMFLSSSCASSSPEISTNRIDILRNSSNSGFKVRSCECSKSRCSCDYGGTCLQGCQRTWHSHALRRSRTHPWCPCPPPTLLLLSTLVAALICPAAHVIPNLAAHCPGVPSGGGGERTHSCAVVAGNASSSPRLYLRPNTLSEPRSLMLTC